MSFETIDIKRQYQIVNGFVQLPHNLEEDKSTYTINDALAIYPSAEIGHLDAYTGPARLAGSKHGTQEWLEVCYDLSTYPNS